MIRRVMAVALVLAALISAPVALTEAASLPVLSASGDGAWAPLDECQGCDDNYGWFGEEGGWIAYYAYFENNDGQCNDVRCVRCNGDPVCEGFFDSKEFETASEAAQWLASNSNCGDCQQGGGGTASLLTATEVRDAGKVAELIIASGGAAWLNRERGAVQGRGCAGEGGVGLHIALEASLIAEVAAELEQLEAAIQPKA